VVYVLNPLHLPPCFRRLPDLGIGLIEELSPNKRAAALLFSLFQLCEVLERVDRKDNEPYEAQRYVAGTLEEHGAEPLAEALGGEYCAD
jgi:hypothetical protein